MIHIQLTNKIHPKKFIITMSKYTNICIYIKPWLYRLILPITVYLQTVQKYNKMSCTIHKRTPFRCNLQNYKKTLTINCTVSVHHSVKSSLVHILTEVKLIKKIAQISTVWNTCRCTCMLKSGTTTCRILHYREKQDTVLLLSSEKYWKWDQQTSLRWTNWG